jgi:hypothetical protein
MIKNNNQVYFFRLEGTATKKGIQVTPGMRCAILCCAYTDNIEKAEKIVRNDLLQDGWTDIVTEEKGLFDTSTLDDTDPNIMKVYKTATELGVASLIFSDEITMNIDEQKAVCKKYCANYLPVSSSLKVGISKNIQSGVKPINGLRHSIEGDTSGWYIWAGDEIPKHDDNFFVPLHISHLEEKCPLAIKFLGLPPGWRFLTDGKHEDVWEDESLLGVKKESVNTKDHFFLFEENGHNYSPDLSPHIIRGPYKTILKYISRKKLASSVGGYVLWEAPQKSDPRMLGGAIGVYGNREVPKFKRILREAGANFTVLKERGPYQKIDLIFNRKKMVSGYAVLSGDIFKQRFVYGNKFLESIFRNRTRSIK